MVKKMINNKTLAWILDLYRQIPQIPPKISPLTLELLWMWLVCLYLRIDSFGCSELEKRVKTLKYGVRPTPAYRYDALKGRTDTRSPHLPNFPQLH